MKGLVIKNTGSSYVVRTDSGQTLNCIVKGNFRLKGIRSTNPVAVGDRVVVSTTQTASPPDGQQPHLHFITEIEDRRNYIIRKSINLSKQSHILAANVDQALLLVCMGQPLTSTTFIDRFLASAEAYRVPVVLAFNKTDLLTPDELRLQQMVIALYAGLGYECLPISAATGSGLQPLEGLLQGRITVLSGNSGVGKSTLINRLVPGANLRTAQLSQVHHTGQHTTTFSEMIPLPAATGYLIDTPGIKGFGTFDIEPSELSGYFREIFSYSQHCRFSNCTHTHEPGCAVLQALEQQRIAQSRYQSYLSMMHDKDEAKYREAY